MRSSIGLAAGIAFFAATFWFGPYLLARLGLESVTDIRHGSTLPYLLLAVVGFVGGLIIRRLISR